MWRRRRRNRQQRPLPEGRRREPDPRRTSRPRRRAPGPGTRRSGRTRCGVEAVSRWPPYSWATCVRNRVSGERPQPLEANVEDHQHDYGRGKVRRLAGQIAEAAEALRDVPDAERGQGTGSHHGQGKTDTKAQHQRGAECEFLQLQTQEQHGDGSRAGNEAARESKHHDLPGGHLAVGKAPADVVGVRELMRVLVTGSADVELLVGLQRVVVMMLDELQIVVMTVLTLCEAQPCHELVRLGNFLHRFEVSALSPEAEELAAAVAALGLDLHLLRRPGRAAFGTEAESRRHPLLEDLQPYDT